MQGASPHPGRAGRRSEALAGRVSALVSTNRMAVATRLLVSMLGGRRLAPARVLSEALVDVTAT
jgi:hypothetical protein